MDQITKDIYNAIKKSKLPLSTRQICLEINREWNSVQSRCIKLQIDGKIVGLKVGNMNVWKLK